jgi:SPP1 family predicted phage head-tail adaptor
MQAGKLDQRITIEVKTVARNSIGEETETWATFATVWAAYRPMSARERAAGAQLTSEFDAVFRIRYLASLDPEMRVTWRGQRFEIVAPPMEVNARSREIDLFVRSGVRDGR